ncbi:hemin uptake protein HemP [Thioalkalivibrio paradoxus]|uniref:hemin uptake protein HemP n=1 Tax=Thioalkalivibrio paradoxus TaxID=108010 RepID=UPI00022C26FF|nr:hemin uptake protein HemP [Thioalkalivibrio paradoxus]
MATDSENNGRIRRTGNDQPAHAGGSGRPIPTTRSDVLLGSARQLRIEHEGEWYVLRQTNRNKLILTK